MIVIRSHVKPTHRQRGEVEAWFYAGQPKEEWPDWVRSHFQGSTAATPRAGRWAVRDEEGYFWRWYDAEKFNQLYERITP